MPEPVKCRALPNPAASITQPCPAVGNVMPCHALRQGQGGAFGFTATGRCQAQFAAIKGVPQVKPALTILP